VTGAREQDPIDGGPADRPLGAADAGDALRGDLDLATVGVADPVTVNYEQATT
jgi:hypothetical protein